MLQQVITSYKPKNSLQEQGGSKMRKPSVTRTISTLNVTVLGVDITSCDTMTKTYPVYESEVPHDEEKLFNYICKMYETETFKISSIIDKTRVTKTYTVPLSKFIEVAEVVGETTTKDEADTADPVDPADPADEADPVDPADPADTADTADTAQ